MLVAAAHASSPSCQAVQDARHQPLPNCSLTNSRSPSLLELCCGGALTAQETCQCCFSFLGLIYFCHLGQVPLTVTLWALLSPLAVVNMYPDRLPSNYTLPYFIASEVLCQSEILFVNEMGFDI